MEGNDRLNDALHGADGPMHVSTRAISTTCRAGSSQAVQALGEPYNHDFNGPRQRGVGFYQFMNRRGRRSSAAYAYIAPLERDPELTVRLRTPRCGASRSRTGARSA